MRVGTDCRTWRSLECTSMAGSRVMLFILEFSPPIPVTQPVFGRGGKTEKGNIETQECLDF